MRYLLLFLFALLLLAGCSKATPSERKAPREVSCDDFKEDLLEELEAGLWCIMQACGSLNLVEAGQSSCAESCSGIVEAPSGWPNTAAVISIEPPGPCGFVFESPLERAAFSISECLRASAEFSQSLDPTLPRNKRLLTDASIRMIKNCEGVVPKEQICPYVQRTVSISSTSQQSMELLSLYRKNCNQH